MFLGLGGLIGLSTCRLRPEDLAWPYMSRTCFDWYKDPEKKYTPLKSHQARSLEPWGFSISCEHMCVYMFVLGIMNVTMCPSEKRPISWGK